MLFIPPQRKNSPEYRRQSSRGFDELALMLPKFPLNLHLYTIVLSERATLNTGHWKQLCITVCHLAFKVVVLGENYSAIAERVN